MERLMDTIIDVQEVQAELDKAAHDARSGPAEVRAGRFIHEKAAKLSDGTDGDDSANAGGLANRNSLS
jgi:hypothetical protein